MEQIADFLGDYLSDAGWVFVALIFFALAFTCMWWCSKWREGDGE